MSDSAVDSPSRPWLAAFFWSATASLSFLLIYGGVNQLTHLRARTTHIPTAALPWELRYIPIIPAMIVPYMSIDLFFAASFFLCRDKAELYTHTKRLYPSLAIACACFLLFPLTSAFPRTPVPGFFAPVFRFLWSADAPYNMAPSLHLAFRGILWVTYVRHTRGLVRLSVKLWFILIGLSTLLTHQHQLLDVVTGQFLGFFCLYLFPDAAPEPSPRRLYNARSAVRYATGVALLLIASVYLRPWGLLLLWPAVCCGILAAAYWRLGPAVFRKSAGRVPFTARLVLFPYIAGATLARAFMRRGADVYNEIAPNLLIGRHLSTNQARRAVADSRITAVLDLTAEYSEPLPLLQLPYLNIPLLDLTAPTPEELSAAVAFLRRHTPAGPVLIHCALGYSRSAAVAAAYLLSTGLAKTPEDAAAHIRQFRPACRLDTLAVSMPAPTSASPA